MLGIALDFQSSMQSRGQLVTHVLAGQLTAHNDVSNAAFWERTRSVFFGGTLQLSAVRGAIHPARLPGHVDSSNEAGFQMLKKHLNLGKVVEVPELVSSVAEGSLAVFGGPVSSLHSRFIMGWQGPSLLLGVELPIRFSSAGGGQPTNPDEDPWLVVVDGRTSDRECLVITSLPLGIYRERLTIFSGLRPAGMRAIDPLLRNERLMDVLSRKTLRLDAWQAIVEVNVATREDPTSVSDLRVYEIGINIDDPGTQIRDKLVLDERTMAKLINLLPYKRSDNVDYSNSAVTGMAGYQAQKLHKLLQNDMILREESRISNDRGQATSSFEPSRDANRHLETTIPVGTPSRSRKGLPATPPPPEVRHMQATAIEFQGAQCLVNAIGNLKYNKDPALALFDIAFRLRASDPTRRESHPTDGLRMILANLLEGTPAEEYRHYSESDTAQLLASSESELTDETSPYSILPEKMVDTVWTLLKTDPDVPESAHENAKAIGATDVEFLRGLFIQYFSSRYASVF